MADPVVATPAPESDAAEDVSKGTPAGLAQAGASLGVSLEALLLWLVGLLILSRSTV